MALISSCLAAAEVTSFSRRPSLSAGFKCKEAQLRDCPGPLSLGGERCGVEATSQATEERSPVHHSIT
jgi:hypothetical protein